MTKDTQHIVDRNELWTLWKELGDDGIYITPIEEDGVAGISIVLGSLATGYHSYELFADNTHNLGTVPFSVFKTLGIVDLLLGCEPDDYADAEPISANELTCTWTQALVLGNV